MTVFLRLLAAFGCLAPASAGFADTNTTVPLPRVFLLDARQLATARERLRANDDSVVPALEKLDQDADKALKAGPFSVTFKAQAPPSGDKHDYLSQAPYFWPNPNTSNGLPYVRHDGRRNPEIGHISDHRSIGVMSDAVETLALAYYFTGKAEYARKAAGLVRTWFLDPDTRMNPNLEFAQAVPGVSSGRSFGLIESRGLCRVVDAAGLLDGSPSWTAADRHGLEDWFAKFLRWMQESKSGREEAANKNNHGTYYDLQLSSFALFLGQEALARETLEMAKSKRIARQIEPDGQQPLELARTNAWGYSVGNLRGLMSLADLGEQIGVDLWNYQTADGRGIRKALEYLAGFVLEDKPWPYTSHPSTESLYPVLRRAGLHYHDAAFRKLLAKVPALSRGDRVDLLGHE